MTAPKYLITLMLISFLLSVRQALPQKVQATAQEACRMLSSQLASASEEVSTTLVVPDQSSLEGVTSHGTSDILSSICRLQIVRHPTPDSNIGIEVWLPLNKWNGRLRGFGNGAFGGDIPLEDIAAAARQGYAAVGTDAGHKGTDASFAIGHPEKIRDFGWRAVHEMTVAARAAITEFYGVAPKYAYFSGCSDGGREALMEVQRFPSDYDGVLAGAPAYDWTHLLGAGALIAQELYSRPRSFISSDALPIIAEAVRKQCLTEGPFTGGVIQSPASCRFNPALLLCSSSRRIKCLNHDQVRVLRLIYATKRYAGGRTLYPGYSPGSEDAPGGWAGWLLGKGPNDVTGLQFFVNSFFGSFLHQTTAWNIHALQKAVDLPAAVKTMGPDLDATSPAIQPFTKRGGKLIIYHGWSDPAVPPEGTLRYFNRIRNALHRTETQDSVRLFMVPGMLHCDGGPGGSLLRATSPRGANQSVSDIFTELERWVENAQSPHVLALPAYAAQSDAKAGERISICQYGATVKQKQMWACR